jgi:hypothetical protein
LYLSVAGPRFHHHTVSLGLAEIISYRENLKERRCRAAITGPEIIPAADQPDDPSHL